MLARLRSIRLRRRLGIADFQKLGDVSGDGRLTCAELGKVLRTAPWKHWIPRCFVVGFSGFVGHCRVFCVLSSSSLIGLEAKQAFKVQANYISYHLL